MTSTLPLFHRDRRGAPWQCPTLHAPDAIFVEHAEPNEPLQPLTSDDFAHVCTVWQRLRDRGWTQIGFEAGREFGAIAFRANAFDTPTITDPRQWELAQQPRLVRWAVEYPHPDGGPRFVRRAFWVATHHTVPEGRHVPQRRRKKKKRTRGGGPR